MKKHMEHFSMISSDSEFGNFCWPSVTRLKDGRLITVCSGHRFAHVCPFGKVVVSVSEDDSSLLTVYYQIPAGKENRAILATKWNIAEFDV